MATSSTISILKEDNTVQTIYCHWDGYLSNNGKILLNHYKTADKVKELISLGSLSSLEKNINPSEGSNHSFSKAEKDVCVFYHRDRNEDLDINSFNSVDKYYNSTIFEEFNYLFDEKQNKWFVMSGIYNNVVESDFNKLTQYRINKEK